MRYLRWGVDGEAVQLENAEVQIMFENGANPQRRVHALLGGSPLTQNPK